MKIIENSYNKSAIFLVVSLLLFEGAVFYACADRPYWGDEAHFVETVNKFGESLSLDVIKHYEEMSTPLPFILYSAWGRIFSFDIQILRLFSVLIAFTTYLLFHKLLFSLFNNAKIALLSTAFIVLHPYMVGLSVFVFTEMLAILFIVISCISIREQKPIILSIALACGLLCRQYLIFFTLAAGLHYLVKYYGNRDKGTREMLLSCVVSLIPLAILGVLWKGLSPDNELRNVYLDEEWRFHLSYFTLYVCQLFIYLAPVILIFRKTFYNNPKTLFISFMASGFYWLFPVRACKFQVMGNIYTTGLFHKTVQYIFGSPFIVDVVFYIAFASGLPILLFIVKDTFSKWREERPGFGFFLNLTIILFLMIMPFSYLCWEKYFLPLLPLVVIRILLTRFKSGRSFR